MNERTQQIDEQLMRRCLELARNAKTSCNTPVGSLIALGREIVAEAEELVPNDPDRFAHTEIEAVRRASVRLGRKKFPETTLYTTAEPCFLCSYAIRESNIGRLVIGQSTPHVGGATSRYRILLAPDVEVWGPPPKVIWGVLEDDCLALHR